MEKDLKKLVSKQNHHTQNQSVRLYQLIVGDMASIWISEPLVDRR